MLTLKQVLLSNRDKLDRDQKWMQEWLDFFIPGKLYRRTMSYGTVETPIYMFLNWDPRIWTTRAMVFLEAGSGEIITIPTYCVAGPKRSWEKVGQG